MFCNRQLTRNNSKVLSRAFTKQPLFPTGSDRKPDDATPCPFRFFILFCFQFALCQALKEPEVACDHFYILSLKLKSQKKREKEGKKGGGREDGEERESSPASNSANDVSMGKVLRQHKRSG